MKGMLGRIKLSSTLRCDIFIMTRCTLYTWVQNPGTDHRGVTNKCEKYTGYTPLYCPKLVADTQQ